MKIKSWLCAAILALILLPAALCAAEITEEDMALGGIRLGATRAEVEELYGNGNHYADGVDVWNGEDVGIHAIDYGASLHVTYRSSDRGWHVISVHLGVDDVNEYLSKPSEESQSLETPRGIHLDSTLEDLNAVYGYIPKPECSHNAPPVCGYFYDSADADAALAFYICKEHSPGIRSIWLREKRTR